MKALSPEDCVRVGYFRKPYGISGTLQLAFDRGWEASLEQARVVMVETQGLPVPWFVAQEGIRILNAGLALVDLEWVHDDREARKLCGLSVCLEKSALAPGHPGSPEGQPDITPAGWTGFMVSDPEKHFSGLVIAEADYSGNLVLTVESGGREFLIPLHEDLVAGIDHAQRLLELRLPDGILEF